jgi:hypothetical protein
MTCGHTAADPCDKVCPECGADLRDHDPDAVAEDDTRWVRFWRNWRGTKRVTEVFRRLRYYGTANEEYLRHAAERWGSDIGPASDFNYGWEIVAYPPKKWLMEKIERLDQTIYSSIAERDALVELVEKSDG